MPALMTSRPSFERQMRSSASPTLGWTHHDIAPHASATEVIVSVGHDFIETRRELQRIATHILARARFEDEQRFGLRVTPSGIGTPRFGPDVAVRLAGATLIREHRVDGVERTTALPIDGRSLAEMAVVARVDLEVDFSAGDDTPSRGPIDAPISLDPTAVVQIMTWLHLGQVALDSVIASVTDPSIAQLWPEHFDVGLDVQTSHGRANLGASPGDAFSPVPYLYVAPWGAERPGDPAFWNAPFGATMTAEAGVDEAETAAAFFLTGLRHLGEG